MENLWFRLSYLWGSGFPGAVVVVAMGATSIVGFGLLVTMLLMRSSRLLLFGFLAAEGALFGAAGLVIHLGQRDLFRLLVPRTAAQDPSGHARLVADALSRVVETQHFAARVFVFGLLLAAFALWRERPRAWWHPLFGLGVLLAAITVGTIVVRNHDWYVGTGTCSDPGIDPACKTRMLWGALLDGGQVIRVGQKALWAFAILAAVALVWVSMRDTKRGWVASRRAVLTSSLLCGLGILATAVGHPKALDGAHPLPPLWDGDDQCSLSQTDVDALPRGPVDCAVIDGPLLELKGSGVELAGDRLAAPAELERKLLAMRHLWRELNPGTPARRTLRVMAARTTEVREIRPWLEAARRAGFDRIGVVYRVEPPMEVHTATAGVLARVRCCDAIVSTFSGKSWEEMAASAIPAGR